MNSPLRISPTSARTQLVLCTYITQTHTQGKKGNRRILPYPRFSWGIIIIHSIPDWTETSQCLVRWIQWARAGGDVVLLCAVLWLCVCGRLLLFEDGGW